jgi:hypothetical protein
LKFIERLIIFGKIRGALHSFFRIGIRVALIIEANGGEIMASTSEATERTVHFVLQDLADRLSGENLARIIQLSHQSEAIVHVSYDSWQVLIGVPERNSQSLEAELSSLGYVCTYPYGKGTDILTFVLGNGNNEASI